jgi:hypothetical protein
VKVVDFITLYSWDLEGVWSGRTDFGNAIRSEREETLTLVIAACSQFHQRFKRAFFVQKLHFGSFSSYILALAPKFCAKNACVNVDEIDTYCQFH